MAHFPLPLDNSGVIVTRQFVGSVLSAEHGGHLGVVLVQGPVGPDIAKGAMARTAEMLGVRASGLMEVTDYAQYARLMSSGICPW